MRKPSKLLGVSLIALVEAIALYALVIAFIIMP